MNYRILRGGGNSKSNLEATSNLTSNIVGWSEVREGTNIIGYIPI
jgi:hypothetical protein